MKMMSESAKLVDGHYSLCLPLKNKAIQMPNNHVVAEQRALNLKRKFIRNPELLTEYTSFMNNLLRNNYAVELTEDNHRQTDGKTWYIPHHGVYHPVKHKLRVVFDCRASYQGMSLNHQHLQGPNLASSLVGVITRFRQERIAFMSDVEAMFHHVCVHVEDSDLLRFLWWPHGDYNVDLLEHIMVVHVFGATYLPSCASYALRKCAEDHGTLFKLDVADAVLRNLYVDDCLKSTATETQAIELYHGLRAICSKGGFHLIKWTSNSRVVLAAIPENKWAEGVKNLDLDHKILPMERALSIYWDV